VLEKSLKNHAMSVYADVCRAKSTSTHLPSLSTVCLQYVSVLLLQFAFFCFPCGCHHCWCCCCYHYYYNSGMLDLEARSRSRDQFAAASVLSQVVWSWPRFRSYAFGLGLKQSETKAEAW